MKHTTWLMALGGLVAGCASTGPQPPFSVEGTESSASVNWAHSMRGTAGALYAADAHCVKYGKHAQFAGKVSEYELSYNCVK